jgi:uncharacterized protein YegL
LAVAILIDTSGSMKPIGNQDPLGNAVEAASNFIGQLNADDYVAVISFSDEVNILQDLTTEKTQILSSLQTLEPEGETAMNDAIVKALDLLSNRSERRAIVLITDGRPVGDQMYTFDNALNLSAGRSIPIYPIGFGDVDKNQLTRSAEFSGGIEQITPDSQELTDAFTSILALFRHQYYLTYSSPLELDEQSHEAEIQGQYQGETQSTNVNYIARKPILVSVVQPVVGSALSEDVDLEINIDSLNPISQVDVYLDDSLLTSFIDSSYTFPLNIQQLVAGEHTLKLVAKDTLGFEDTKIVKYIVELPQHEWIYWGIGLALLIAAVIIFSVLKRGQSRKTLQSIRKAVLYEMDGLTPGQEWDLNKNIIRLGRKMADNDIRLKGMDASRNHAVIERSKTGFCIRSLRAENPVLVNGEKVEQRILQHGDVIQMGESVYRFEYRD